MPNHHARHPGKRHAHHIVGASRANGAAMQTHLIPNRWHLNRQVRVIGQQRLAGVGLCASNHPIVAANVIVTVGRANQCVEVFGIFGEQVDLGVGWLVDGLMG